MTLDKRSYFLNLLITFFFLFPVAVLIFFSLEVEGLRISEVFDALVVSLTQGAVSGVLSIVLGFPMACGLLAAKGRNQKILRFLLLLPQFVPPFFTILILLNLISPFPMGYFGIVIVFTFINSGLAAVILANAMNSRILRLSVVSEVLNVSKFKFVTKVALPILKGELLSLFALIISFCISSLAIPLIVGGGKSVNLELLIYEKLYVNTEWSQASVLSLFQTFVVFLIGVVPTATILKESRMQPYNHFFKSKFGLMLSCFYLAVFFIGYFGGLAKSVSALPFLSSNLSELWSAVKNSFLMLSGSFILGTTLLIAILYDFINFKRVNFGLYFFALSTAVVGFSIYVIFPVSVKADLFKFSIAFVILQFPVLFKLFLQESLNSLKRQIQIAEIFGLDKPTTILNVLMPQLLGPLKLMFFVFLIWCFSDFAISKSIGIRTTTLGTMAAELMSSYRLESAFIVSFLILLVGFFLWIVLELLLKVIRVAYK